MTTAQHINATLVQVIAEAVQTSGRSQRSIADDAGMALVTLNRKLKGTSPFNLVEIASIANALGVSLTELALRAERQIAIPA